MTRWTLLRRTVAAHWRSNLGAILAAAASCAVLTGALIVGDSVRFSLLTMATDRLGATQVALLGQDRFFQADLARRIQSNVDFKLGFSDAQSVLLLPGVVTDDSNELRANEIQVCGIPPEFWKLDNSATRDELIRGAADLSAGECLINAKLAGIIQATAGDTLRLRMYKPGLLPQDAPLGAKDDAAIFARVKLKAILPDTGLARFSLSGAQSTTPNLFLPLASLQRELERPNTANVLLLASGANPKDVREDLPEAERALKSTWTLKDAQLELKAQPAFADLKTDRVFLDDALAGPLIAESKAKGILTYFVNAIRAGGKSIPYSMVTAADAPLSDENMKDDEIVLNQWTADELGVKAGDDIELEFFTIGLLRKLESKTAKFKVKSIVPIDGLHADRSLMPQFPGIQEAESTQDWKAGIPIDMKKIRTKDEAYWKKYRGTPKAFITLKRGVELWKNRFGTYTALRFAVPEDPAKARERLDEIETQVLPHAQPQALGLPLLPVKEQALRGVERSMDFGGLFIGLSFFLITAALLLMALIFQFEIESRARETGTLLALGFRTGSVRLLLWSEGLAMVALGAPFGAAAGILYARSIIYGLSSSWKGAVANAPIMFHVEHFSIIYGIAGTLVAAALAIFLAVRKQASHSAKDLLAARVLQDDLSQKTPLLWKLGAVIGSLGAGALTWLAFKAGAADAAGIFFGAGALLLIAAISFVRILLTERAERAGARPTLFALGLRAARRRPGRSLATAALLASGTFLVCAIGVNELNSVVDPADKTTGTGGFALVGRSTIPIFDNLNTKEGRDKSGVLEKGMEHTLVFPLRVKSGEEASCLNLNHAERPRILGVPSSFVDRGGFTFSQTLRKTGGEPWKDILGPRANPNDPIPAVVDSQSMQWALQMSLGDQIEVLDEQGRKRHLQLVGALSNSILQGSLLISEADFLTLYPSESGYRMFLIDSPPSEAPAVARNLALALSDFGFETQSAPARLADYNAVQNTYLSTFQALGAFGVLLGSLGLGIVVLRNMLERRQELAMLRALGFSDVNIATVILVEHAYILLLGLGAGLLAALFAVAPTVHLSGTPIPWTQIATTLGAIAFCGLASAALATFVSLRAPLIEGLRAD